MPLFLFCYLIINRNPVTGSFICIFSTSCMKFHLKIQMLFFFWSFLALTDSFRRLCNVAEKYQRNQQFRAREIHLQIQNLFRNGEIICCFSVNNTVSPETRLLYKTCQNISCANYIELFSFTWLSCLPWLGQL